MRRSKRELALIARLSTAGWPDSPVSPEEQARTLAPMVSKLGRPKPCGGEAAPESRTYGPRVAA